MEQEQKKSILIIKANTQSLIAAEGFLRNRDWKIKATANLKEALVYLVQEQPAFVMISVDHANKKVQKLPKVLAAAFPCCVIAFAEESATASYKALSASPTEYQIYPPITGPAIERIVNKYYKDQLAKPALTAAQRAAGETGDGNGTISIKGSNGLSSANAQSLLAQMLSNDNNDLVLNDSQTTSGAVATGDGSQKSQASSSVASGSTDSAASVSRGPKESAFEQMNADFQNNLNQSAKTAAYAPKEQKPGSLPPGSAYMPPSPDKNDVNNPGGSGVAKGHLQKGSGFGNVNTADQDGNKAAGKTAHAKGTAAPDLQSDPSLEKQLNRAAKSKGPGWQPDPDYVEKDKQRPKGEVDDSVFSTGEGDSLILRGTKAALEKSCIQLSSNHNQKIDVASNMACLVIESTRFSGYLITAMGKNKVIDEAFLKKIQVRLMNFLKEHGEKVINGESMHITLKQVPFMPWALEQAEFLRRSSHMGNEVAMAFFPRAEIRAKFGESADEEMAAVQLHEFAGDTTVDFNVYIYLPKNNKYVLYTPRGGTFYGRQKDRLSGQGISHLHVLKAEIQDLDKYRAENYLNDSIDDFTNRDRKKQSA